MDIFHKITSVPNHDLLQPLILESINKFNFQPPLRPEREKMSKVSKTDWGVDASILRPYIHYLLPFIQTVLAKEYQSMGGEGIEVTNY